MHILINPDSSSNSYMDKLQTISHLKEDLYRCFECLWSLIFIECNHAERILQYARTPIVLRTHALFKRVWQYKEYKEYNLRKNAGIQNENSWNNHRPIFFVRQSLLCEGQAHDKNSMQTWITILRIAHEGRSVRQISRNDVSLNNNKNKPIRGWTWPFTFSSFFNKKLTTWQFSVNSWIRKLRGNWKFPQRKR